MGKFTKWIAGGLGWAFFGPIGGIIGFVAASFMEKGDEMERQRSQTTTGGFAVTLLILTASVMKADGKILKSELDYVKRYFLQAFGEEAATEAIRMLRDIVKQEIPLNEVCAQVKANMDYASRTQLLHFLYGIADADGEIAASEQKLIEEIGYRTGV
ncbi:MAG: TerB family tellurite resistance protein, partial [Salinivirgaceae bacterium]